MSTRFYISYIYGLTLIACLGILYFRIPEITLVVVILWVIGFIATLVDYAN